MRALSLFVAVLLVSASAAQASPLTLSNMTGDWDPGSVNADGPTGATLSVTNQGGSDVDSIQWGTSLINPGAQSLYRFDPRDGAIDPILESPFLLGTFEHINRTLLSATANFFGADYDFSFDVNGVPGQLSGALSFSHNETVNTGPCVVGVPPCPDVVSLALLNPGLQINVGNDVYVLELLGFSLDGGGSFSDTFVSGESAANRAGLYAVVSFVSSNEIPQVPEPASLGLLGAGLGLVSYQLRRRKAKAKKAA